MTNNYDIFISYRRDGGFETAKHLNDLLVHDGYSVSFDIDTLREGNFDETLLCRIDQCLDFILIVEKHTFDRTLDSTFDSKKDWLRTELAYALKMKKNIIPILLSGVDGFPPNLPVDIADVITKNSPEYNKYYFDEFYKKLKTFLHCVPRNTTLSKDVATIQFLSEIDTDIHVDGVHLLFSKAKVLTKTQLALGDHLIEYHAINSNDLKYSEIFTASDARNYVVKINYQKESKLNRMRPRFAIIITISVLIGFIIFYINKHFSKYQEPNSQIIQTANVEYYNNTLFVNGEAYQMLPIKGGEFNMGKEGDEEAQIHRVLLNDYLIGETEIPQSIWKAIMGTNPSRHVGDNYPVEQVSWHDCQNFIAKLNELSGQTFRLPTEAEWEYAALNKDFNIQNLDDYAWYNVNSGHTTHAIGQKSSNSNGLKDVYGNVWEWCNDFHAKYSKG